MIEVTQNDKEIYELPDEIKIKNSHFFYPEAAALIRAIPDYPKPGIIFRDITPVLGNSKVFRSLVYPLVSFVRDLRADVIVGIESRGFIFGAPIAYELGISFVPVRKPGNLPYETYKENYNLEYGSNTLEIHKDAFEPGKRVVIIDDLLATGGTALASAKLVEQVGGKVVGFGFAIELLDLKGKEFLNNYNVETLLKY